VLTPEVVPGVLGVLTPAQCRQTAKSIAATQESSGAIPWFDGGHTDPWDHVENAMALTAAGLLEPARAAFEWSRTTQRLDGSWPIQLRNGVIEDANSDSNFCAYIATGVWHHVLITDDRRFAENMWPVLTGCASIYHSLRCALALADYFEDPQPEWEVAVGRLGHAIVHHPEVFAVKDRWSMEWYYPVLGGAVQGEAARARIDERWNDFVVPGLGIRCVDDRPWVTGAETCELVMALDAIGDTGRAREQFAAMHHLREDDGSYWTGRVFADGKRWPEERTTWTGAAMILAADALSKTTAASGIFRGAGLPRGLEGAYDCECATSER
jgi:hypothetical protein